jgi:hypothetical protein
MRMRERDLHGEATFCGTDVDQRLVVLPRKLRCDRLGGQQAPRRHGFDEAPELLGITVSGGKVTCSRCANLRRSGSQRFRQRTPEAEAGRAVLLEQRTNVGRLLAVEIEVGVGRIGVASLRVACQETERNE